MYSPLKGPLKRPATPLSRHRHATCTLAATSRGVVRVAMPLTPEQKCERRRLDREAAAAGDADAQKRRAAERERIDKKFSQRTAAEQRERMKERRQRIRSAAEKGDEKGQ